MMVEQSFTLVLVMVVLFVPCSPGPRRRSAGASALEAAARAAQPSSGASST